MIKLPSSNGLNLWFPSLTWSIFIKPIKFDQLIVLLLVLTNIHVCIASKIFQSLLAFLLLFPLIFLGVGGIDLHSYLNLIIYYNVEDQMKLKWLLHVHEHILKQRELIIKLQLCAKRVISKTIHVIELIIKGLFKLAPFWCCTFDLGW